MEREQKQESMILQWKPGSVGVPHVFARSGIFECYGRTESDDYRIVPALGNYQIEIKGSTLTIYDFVVYMALMSMCWKQDIKDEKYRKDTRVNCTLGDLAAYMGNKRTQANASNVIQSLDRLASTNLKIHDKKAYFRGSLISLTVQLPSNGKILTSTKISILINNDLQSVYIRGRWGNINPLVVRALGRDYTAIKLYVFFASHRNAGSQYRGERRSLEYATNTNTSDFKGLYFYSLDKLQTIIDSSLPPHKFAAKVYESLQRIQSATYKYGYMQTLKEYKTYKLMQTVRNESAKHRAVKSPYQDLLCDTVIARTAAPEYEKLVSTAEHRLYSHDDVLVFYMKQLQQTDDKRYKYKVAVDFGSKLMYEQLSQYAIKNNISWKEAKKLMTEEAARETPEAIAHAKHVAEINNYTDRVLDVNNIYGTWGGGPRLTKKKHFDDTSDYDPSNAPPDQWESYEEID